MVMASDYASSSLFLFHSRQSLLRQTARLGFSNAERCGWSPRLAAIPVRLLFVNRLLLIESKVRELAI
jgi:hypothetical protein